MLSHRYLAAGSSPLLPARDVRDELQRSPSQGAHPTLLLHPCGGLPSLAPCSPPTPYLLRRAGPVNRGAVWGRVQLDGRRLLLGHFEPGKGASNSEGKAAPLLPPSAMSRALRAGTIRGRGPGTALEGRHALRGQSATRGCGGLAGPPPYSPGARLRAQGTEGLPNRRSPAAQDSLPLSLSQPIARTQEAPQRAYPNPAPNTARESAAAAVAGLLVAPHRGPGEGLEGRGGAGKGAAAFSTHPVGSAPLPRRQPMRASLGGR